MEMFNSAEKNGEADAIYYKGVVYAKKGDNKSALKQYFYKERFVRWE